MFDCIFEHYFYFQTQEKYIKYFENYLKKEGQMTVSLDEWSSIDKRRYLNIVLNLQSVSFNLGLVRIFGRATSLNLLNLIKTKLSSFNLTLNNIQAFSSDGAPVMTCLARLANKQVQLCFLHAIHLGVSRVLYNSPKSSVNQKELISVFENPEKNMSDFYAILNSPINDDSNELEEEINLSNFMDEDVLNTLEDDWNKPIEFEEEINILFELTDQELIDKVRKVVKKITASSHNKEVLANATERDETIQKRLSIHLDCPTRWDSMFTMLKEFYRMRNCIPDVLLNITTKERETKRGKKKELDLIIFTEEELDRINVIITALDPIHHCIAQLSNSETDLFRADLTLELMFDMLSVVDTEFSKKLYECVLDEVLKRRTILSDIHSFLNDPKGKFFGYRHFEKPSEKLLLESMIDLMKKDDSYPTDFNLSSENNNSEHSPRKRSFDEMIADTYTKSQQQLKPSNFENINELMIHDFERFKLNNQDSLLLQKLKTKVSVVPPTSINCERTFSLSSRTLTKFRCRLSDQTFDSIIFLKYHFLKMENFKTNA